MQLGEIIRVFEVPAAVPEPATPLTVPHPKPVPQAEPQAVPALPGDKSVTPSVESVAVPPGEGLLAAANRPSTQVLARAARRGPWAR
jgi:hypothetical protein